MQDAMAEGLSSSSEAAEQLQELWQMKGLALEGMMWTRRATADEAVGARGFRWGPRIIL